MQAYLKSAGWTLAHENPGAANYYRLAAKPDDYEVLVPLSESASGYPQRVKELLRELKAIEGRPELEIFQDIEEWDADVIRMRLEFDGPHMAPRLEFMRTFLEAGRDLLLYGAAMEHTPQPWYGNEIPAKAFEFLETVEVQSFEEPWTLRFRIRLASTVAITAGTAHPQFARPVHPVVSRIYLGLSWLKDQVPGEIPVCGEFARALIKVMDNPDAWRARFVVSIRPALCRPLSIDLFPKAVGASMRFSKTDIAKFRGIPEILQDLAELSASKNAAKHDDITLELKHRLDELSTGQQTILDLVNRILTQADGAEPNQIQLRADSLEVAGISDVVTVVDPRITARRAQGGSAGKRAIPRSTAER